MRIIPKDRKCCNCENDNSYIGNVAPRWRGHKCNKDCCTGYLCYYCYNDIEREKTAIIANERHICYICRVNKTINWHKYKDGKGDWNGKSYMCHECYRDITILLKKGECPIDSTTGIGLIIESVIAKVRKIKNYNIEIDNFGSPFDLFLDSEFKIIQVKSRTLKNGRWRLGYCGDADFDTLFFVCLDKDRKNIERIYVIPWEDVVKTTNIEIVKNPSRCTWYDNVNNAYRIDESPYNDTYHDLMSYLGDKKYFGIEDIKNWLENRYNKADVRQ